MRFPNLLSLSRTHARLAALLVAGVLVTPMLYGCDAQGTTSADDSQGSAEASASSAESSSDADDSTDSSTGSDADSTDSEEETIEFDYSEGIDEDGHWSGVRALDYVTLPADYASIQAPASSVVPSDDDVQTQMDGIMSNYSTTEQVTDQEVADGDTINIDYVGKIDGVEFDGGSTDGNGTTVTIGTTQYIDDFLEQLIGHKPGETFDIEVTFPDDYGVDDLNGKDATFTVTINYIQKTTTPELTDDWVAENLKDTYGWSTVEEMRAGVKEDLQYSNLATYVQDYVLNNSTVTEVPQAIIDYQGQQYLYQYQTYATTYGTTLSALLQMYTGASTTEEFLTSNADALESAARSYLIFQAIMEDAGITETDEEYEAYVESATSSDVETVEATYGKNYLMLRALLQKTGDYLIDHTTVVEDEDADASDETDAGASDETGSTKASTDESAASDEKDADASETADAAETSASTKASETSATSSTTSAKSSASTSTASEKDADASETSSKATASTSSKEAASTTSASSSTSTSTSTASK